MSNQITNRNNSITNLLHKSYMADKIIQLKRSSSSHHQSMDAIRRNLWSRKETNALLRIFKERNVVSLLMRKSNSPVKIFTMVESQMAGRGFTQKSTLQIMRKWKKLKSTYSVKYRPKSGIIDETKIPYFKEIHELMTSRMIANDSPDCSADDIDDLFALNGETKLQLVIFLYIRNFFLSASTSLLYCCVCAWNVSVKAPTLMRCRQRWAPSNKIVAMTSAAICGTTKKQLRCWKLCATTMWPASWNVCERAIWKCTQWSQTKWPNASLCERTVHRFVSNGNDWNPVIISIDKAKHRMLYAARRSCDCYSTFWPTEISRTMTTSKWRMADLPKWLMAMKVWVTQYNTINTTHLCFSMRNSAVERLITNVLMTMSGAWCMVQCVNYNSFQFAHAKNPVSTMQWRLAIWYLAKHKVAT